MAFNFDELEKFQQEQQTKGDFAEAKKIEFPATSIHGTQLIRMLYDEKNKKYPAGVFAAQVSAFWFLKDLIPYPVFAQTNSEQYLLIKATVKKYADTQDTFLKNLVEAIKEEKQFYMPAIIFDDAAGNITSKEQNLKLFKFKTALMQGIVPKILHPKKRNPPIWDMEGGTNLEITRTGTGMNTKYVVDYEVPGNASPAPKMAQAWYDEIPCPFTYVENLLMRKDKVLELLDSYFGSKSSKKETSTEIMNTDKTIVNDL